MAWCYTAAQGLIAYDPPVEMTWQDGEDDKTYLQRINYQESYEESVGNEMLAGGYKTSVARDEKATYRYLVLINAPLNHVEEVWIPTFPDWLMFLSQYGPGITGYAIDTRLSDLTDLLEKLFQAWHGHSAMDLCRECDPHGYARQIERRRKAQAKKAAGYG